MEPKTTAMVTTHSGSNVLLERGEVEDMKEEDMDCTQESEDARCKALRRLANKISSMAVRLANLALSTQTWVDQNWGLPDAAYDAAWNSVRQSFEEVFRQVREEEFSQPWVFLQPAMGGPPATGGNSSSGPPATGGDSSSGPPATKEVAAAAKAHFANRVCMPSAPTPASPVCDEEDSPAPAMGGDSSTSGPPATGGVPPWWGGTQGYFSFEDIATICKNEE